MTQFLKHQKQTNGQYSAVQRAGASFDTLKKYFEKNKKIDLPF